MREAPRHSKDHCGNCGALSGDKAGASRPRLPQALKLEMQFMPAVRARAVDATDAHWRKVPDGAQVRASTSDGLPAVGPLGLFIRGQRCTDDNPFRPPGASSRCQQRRSALTAHRAVPVVNHRVGWSTLRALAGKLASPPKSMNANLAFIKTGLLPGQGRARSGGLVGRVAEPRSRRIPAGDSSGLRVANRLPGAAAVPPLAR